MFAHSDVRWPLPHGHFAYILKVQQEQNGSWNIEEAVAFFTDKLQKLIESCIIFLCIAMNF